MIDVSVLLEFFNRPTTFKEVFEQVRIAQPTTLLLYQDGPRVGNEEDPGNIALCRAIAENIDCPCTVYKKYQDCNVGCDPSGYIAQSWAFTLVEKCIILEDDCVPSQSFFPFCKELLDKYEFDDRINIICGMNNTEVTKRISADYLFTIKGSIWGWATWRRVAKTWDPEYKWLDDAATIDSMRVFYHNNHEFEGIIERARDRRASGKAYFEYILGPAAWRDKRYNIVPKYNLISNHGPTEGGTHCDTGMDHVLPSVRKLFYMKTYEYQFPLQEPIKVKRDFRFEKEMTLSPTRIKIEQLILRAEQHRRRIKNASRKLKTGEISARDCTDFLIECINAKIRLNRFTNVLSSPTLILGANLSKGNRIACGTARVTRLNLKIKGTNNSIVFDKGCKVHGCKISVLGDNNSIRIGKHSNLMQGARDKLGCYISIGGSDNSIVIGDYCHLIDVEIFAEDQKNNISIGNNCGVYNRTSLSAIEGTELCIGANSLISSDVHFRTGDSHTLLDQNGIRCNPSQNIIIGEHVWIGTRAIFLKGSEVASNCIVGADALISKKFSEDHSVIAGSPARILKKGFSWKTERI